MRSAQPHHAPCGHRGCTAALGQIWWTAPNVLTGARTVGTEVVSLARPARLPAPTALPGCAVRDAGPAPTPAVQI